MKVLLISLALLSVAACEFKGGGSRSSVNPGAGVGGGRAPFSGSLRTFEGASQVEHILGDVKQHHYGFLKNVKSLHFNSYSVAALRTDGSVITWQTCCSSTSGSVGDVEVYKDVIEVFSSNSAFLGLKNDGSLIGWGYGINGIDLVDISDGIEKVAATNDAFAFLKKDGSLALAGNSSSGGATAIDFSVGVKQLISNNSAFAALLNDGRVVSWGDIRYGGESPVFDPGKTVKKLYSNDLSFIALFDDGTAQSWGYVPYGGDSSGIDFTSGIKEIYSNRYSYLILKNDESLVTWGDSSGGTNHAPDLSGPFADVYPYQYGYFAVREDGSVIGWGSYAGAIGSVDFSSGIRKFATSSGHIALKNDGSIVSWGQYPMNFDYSHLPLEIRPTGNIIDVAAKGSYFAALRADGVAVAWTNGWYREIKNVVKMYTNETNETEKSIYFLDSAGNITVVGQDSFDHVERANQKLIKSIHSNGNSIIALHEDNTISAWGSVGYGADVTGIDLSAGIEKIIFNNYSFAVLLSDKSVVTWGNTTYGGDSSDMDLTNVRDITATGYGYSALKEDGSLVSWGSDKGNYVPTGLDLTNAVKIFSTSSALAILTEDGRVFTLGQPFAGGNSSGYDLTNVKNVFSSNNGFVALKNDGSAVTWGSNYHSTNASLTEGVKEIYSSDGHFIAIKEDGEFVQWGVACVIDKTKDYVTGLGVKNGILLIDSDGLLVPACGINHGGYNSLYADDYYFQTDGANIYLFQ